MGTIGRSASGRKVISGQVMLWSIRSSLLNARSKPASIPSRSRPQLVEMIAADHHEYVGLGVGQCLAERLDLGHPFVSEWRPVVSRGGARAVVERVVGGCDN